MSRFGARVSELLAAVGLSMWEWLARLLVSGDVGESLRVDGGVGLVMRCRNCWRVCRFTVVSESEWIVAMGMVIGMGLGAVIRRRISFFRVPPGGVGCRAFRTAAEPRRTIK